MLLEMVLVLGFVVPVLVPITAAAMVLHAIALEICVNHQGTVLTHITRPPVKCLYFSLCLGSGFVIWMFAECGWTGRILVFVGLPVSSLLGVLAPDMCVYLNLSRRLRDEVKTLPQLKEPLLPVRETACAEMAELSSTANADGIDHETPTDRT